jgi:hypothetical protein
MIHSKNTTTMVEPFAHPAAKMWHQYRHYSGAEGSFLQQDWPRAGSNGFFSILLYGRCLPKFGILTEILESHQGYKWCHCGVIEATDSNGMFPIWFWLNTYKRCLRTFICWVGGGVHHHANIATTIFGSADLGIRQKSWSHTWATSSSIVEWLRLQVHCWIH